jgi:hypothetical protein
MARVELREMPGQTGTPVIPAVRERTLIGFLVETELMLHLRVAHKALELTQTTLVVLEAGGRHVRSNLLVALLYQYQTGTLEAAVEVVVGEVYLKAVLKMLIIILGMELVPAEKMQVETAAMGRL